MAHPNIYAIALQWKKKKSNTSFLSVDTFKFAQYYFIVLIEMNEFRSSIRGFII